MEIGHCKDCRFYEDKLSGAVYWSDRDGLCRRYPRNPLQRPSGTLVMVMCETNKMDWCGEFVQR